MSAHNGSYLVSQGYQIVNYAYLDAIGQSNNNAIDTSDWVSMGKQLSDFNLLDKFYGALTNRIAKTIEYVLKYKADGRQILHDSVTYGAFIQKVYVDGFDFVETPSYKLDPDSVTEIIPSSSLSSPFDVAQTFKHTVKIFGGSTTWSLEFKQSEIVLRKCVTSESEIMALIDSEFAFAKTKCEIAKEELVNVAIATGIVNAMRGGCVRNLLHEYNQFATNKVTRADAYRNADFLKWANMQINRDLKLMKKPSKKYNPEKYLNACDSPICEVVSLFADSSSVYLESGTYHADKVALSGQYNELPYWQFNGDKETDFTKVRIKNIDLWNDGQSTPSAIDVISEGIVAIARDRDAVACHFDNNYTWSYPNPRERSMAYGYDFERGYAVDGHANFIVYTVNDDPTYIDGTNKANLASHELVGTVAVGNTVEIKATPTNGKTVNTVKVSYDNGTNWTTISAVDGKYFWTIEKMVEGQTAYQINMNS